MKILICRGFLPNRIYLVNSPCTIDLGGISKQFYTELSSGLALLIEGEQLPTLADPHFEKNKRVC